MRHYFFNIHSGKRYAQDCEGRDLPDLETARDEAMKVAQQLWSGLSAHVACEEMEIEVADEAGRPVLIMPLREAARRLEQKASQPHRHNGMQ